MRDEDVKRTLEGFQDEYVVASSDLDKAIKSVLDCGYPIDPTNPRYLLWMLYVGHRKIPEGPQYQYMAWIHYQHQEFKDLVRTDKLGIMQFGDFDEWLRYDVRYHLVHDIGD